MNWEVIGATGEWAGAIGIVVTLFYLARQIRQQNINTNVGMQESILEGFNHANTLLAGSEELSGIFMKGLWNPEELSDDQASQFQWILRIYMNQYLKVYRLHQQGALSEEDWIGHASGGAYLLNTPGGRIYREAHGESFKDFFDTVVDMKSEIAPLDISFGRRGDEPGDA